MTTHIWLANRRILVLPRHSVMMRRVSAFPPAVESGTVPFTSVIVHVTVACRLGRDAIATSAPAAAPRLQTG